MDLADERVVLDLQVLYENAPCGYHSVDASGTILKMNRTELDWLGMRRGDVVGKLKIDQLMTPTSRSLYRAEIRKLMRSGRPVEIEVELVRKNHTRFDGFLSIVGVRDDAQAFMYTRATVIDISARKRAEREVRLYATQLQAISKRVVDIQESERRAISTELHDRLGQDLAAINVNLHILRDRALHNELTAMVQRIDDSIAIVEHAVQIARDVCGALRPLMLDDYGVLVALRSYAAEFASRTGLEVSVVAREHTPRLGREVEMALFRVSQEALNNVLKHAKATSVAVTLDLEGSNLLLRIEDDGCGYDPGAASPKSGKGLGLLIMQERLRTVNGCLEISSSARGGAALTARVPTSP